jgi:hypothetical protein
MALIRLNQLHQEIMQKVDEKDIAIKEQIETTLQYTVGPTPPETPSIGHRWFDTSVGLLKIWNGTNEGADWELVNANTIYLPGRNAIESEADNIKNNTDGSGFIEFGGKIKTSKMINESMLANDGIPRLAGIIGEGEDAIKKFWFENFFLLNANGYSEETLAPSTGEETEVVVDGLRVTIKGTLPNSKVITNNKLMAVNLPTAPSNVDELTREELVFLEVWKEDISETGFVFPYGNVQFTGESADGIETEYFTGDLGYCESFAGDYITVTEVDQNGVETQTKKPKGRGWKWTSLKAAFKNMVAANYKHNIFVDGDKLVQIRYRIRVVSFAKNPALPLTDTTILGFTKDNDATSTIKAQGKLGSVVNDPNYSILAPFNNDNPHRILGTYSTAYTNDLSYDGYVYAIPIAIVSRRNSGVFDTIFNPNGSARFRDGLRLVADYDDSDAIIGFALMDNANATLASSTTGATWDDKYKIMMKWLFDRDTVLTSYDNAKGFVIGGDMNSGISGRYDGLYYDEINIVDIKDLRMDVNKQLDLNYVLEKEFNKFILNEQRGWEREKYFHYVSGNFAQKVKVQQSDGSYLMDNGNYVYGYGFTTEIPIHYKLADGTEIKGIDKKIGEKVTNDYLTHFYVRPGIKSTEASPRPFYSNKFVKRVKVELLPVLGEDGKPMKDIDGKIIKKIVIKDGPVYIDENSEYIIITPKDMPAKETQLFADIIGDPQGNSYKFSTKMKVADLPTNVILENGNIVFTGQNYYVYRGSIKNKTQIENDHMDAAGYFHIDETDTNTWIDVTDKGGYQEGWKMYGNLGSPLLVDEEGNSVIPRDVVSGILDKNGNRIYRKSKFFKLSQPVSNIEKVIVTLDKSAGKKAFLTQITTAKDNKTIMDQVDETPGTFGYDNVQNLTDTNTIIINWESFTDDAIIEIYYKVKSNPAILTLSSKVEILGDVWAGNSSKHDLGCVAISNLIDKVPVYNAPVGSKGAAIRFPLSSYLISKGKDGNILNEEWAVLRHDEIGLDGFGPAVKILPYITSYRGRMYLKLLYKELDPTQIYDNIKGKVVSYTLDNEQFVVVDGEGFDDNGGTGKKVKIGQRKIELPYFFGSII